jgi:hypothetical protein
VECNIEKAWEETVEEYAEYMAIASNEPHVTRCEHPGQGLLETIRETWICSGKT